MPMKLNRCSIRGFTLIETSIVFLAFGILLAGFFPLYALNQKNERMTETLTNTDIIANAISNYFIQNGHYPCPARLNATPSDPDYGVPTDCTDTSVAVGDCSNGICIEERETAIAALGSKPRVRRGAVPFRVLSKPEFLSEDGYRSRIEYVVTEILTDVATYNKNYGGISVVDGQTPPRSLTKDPGTIHFIVFSHGPDRAGAYSRNGVMEIPCGAGQDAENCNTSATAPQAVYRMMQTSESDGADHFDDLVKYFTTVETPLWVIADAAGTNIRDAGIAKQIAVGTAGSFAATDPLSLDVAIHAQAEGTLKTGQLCDHNGLNCFAPELIGGAMPEMDCAGNPDGPYVTAISSGKVTCGDTVEILCPPGQVMKGITASGTLICTAPPATCAAQNVTVCAPDDSTLPASPTGTIITLPVRGDSRVVRYICNSPGNWAIHSQSGVCTCTPSTVTTTPACTGFMSPVGSCWTGNVVRTTTTTCGPYNVATVDNTSGCTCSDCPVPSSQNCSSALPSPLTNPGAVPSSLPSPPGYIGSVSYTRAWQCSTPTTGAFNSWTYTGNTCACNTSITPLVQNNVSCSVTGCDASGSNPSLSGHFPCAPGFVGPGKYVNRHKDYDCATGTYVPNWTNDANTCSCSAVTQQQSVTCPVGYSNTYSQTRTFDCATNSWGPWINDDQVNTPPATCIPIRWVPQGSISGSGSDTSGRVEVYTPCSPVNDTRSCWAPSGTYGVNNYYNICKCQ